MNTNMKFAVTGQRIELTEPVMLVAGTVNIYTAAFVFNSAWEGYTKTAVFRGGDVEREQLLTDDACTVPWEVLAAGKHLRVGVYGTKDDIRLPTIWTERTQYINSGAGPTDEAAEPSPTLVEQLTAKVGNLDALKTEDKSSVVAAVNEIWKSGGGGTGGGTTDHSKLMNRDAAGQHPMSAITGLEQALEGKQPKGNYLTDKDLDTTLKEVGKAADAAAVGERLDSLSEEIADIPGASGNGAGWSTEEIALLEIILGKAVYSTDQTNNIAALITLLKSNSSGSEGSGGGSSGGDSSGTTYTVTLNLDGVTSSNMAQSVASGSVYVNQLSVAAGYTLGTLVITMGGYDVTAQYYDGAGNISIPAVQGDIIITCKALAIETLTIVSANGVPDKTTFSYTEVSSFAQAQVVAKESATAGGVLNVTWDVETITGGPSVRVYLFKDGAPHKLTSNTSNSDPVETSDGTADKSWWAVPGSYAMPLKLTKPTSIVIPDGCTAMACLQRNGMANDTVTTNATWSAWVGAGNITVTVTEGE